jgi:hypothetical protein
MRYIALVIALVVLAYLVMEFNSRSAELNRLRVEQQIVATRRQSRQQTEVALEGQIAYATSDAAVMEWAYRNHLVRPGDVAVVPVQRLQVTATPAPRPVITPTEIDNFQIWLSLFVDPPAPEE